MTSETTPYLQCLGATPGILKSLLALATPEQLLWKPPGDRWSICEILNHLNDVELKVVGLRVRRMLAEELPGFEEYDPGVRYREGAYSNDDGMAALDRFCDTRSESLAWLRESSPSDWTRRGRHPVVGEVTVRQVLSLWSFHDLSHIRQIAEILKAVVFWDEIGSLQTYYSVHP